MRRNEKDLSSLREENITDAEDVVRVLKPIKTATQVVSEEKSQTLEVIAPLHALLLKEMTSLPEDSKVVKDMKDEIQKKLRLASALLMCEKLNYILCFKGNFIIVILDKCIKMCEIYISGM